MAKRLILALAIVLAALFSFSRTSAAAPEGTSSPSGGPQPSDSDQFQSPASTLPTYYVYRGRPENLTLDPVRLAIQYGAPSSTSERSAAINAAGIDVMSEEATGITGWSLLNLATAISGPSDADARIKSLLATSAATFVSPVFRTQSGGWVTMSPTILLRFKTGYESNGDALLATIAPELAATDREFGRMPGAYKLRSSSRNGFDVLAIANRLAADPRVAWAEPDAIFTGRGDLIPNDPGFSSLWGIRNTGQSGGAPGMDMAGDRAWDITTGDPNVKVLILDTGVQQDHPDINQLPGADFTGEGGAGGPVNACDNHGTAVAGCVSAIINNATGTVGIAPSCRVLSARPFTSTLDCSGSWTSTASWTVDALAWGESQGARVSNNSNIYGFTSSAIEDKYASTYAGGMVHFACAGNDASPSISYPSSAPFVNSVAALNQQGSRSSFSNYGVGLDFSAPGSTIYSTDRTGTQGYVSGDYTFVNGTSFASPYAAGVAALIISNNPALTPAQVEAKMQTSSRDLGAADYDTDFGWGFVNAYDGIVSYATLSVLSYNPTSGISITISPADTNGLGDGVTPFERRYSPGRDVTLTAPGIGAGNTFVRWLKDGVYFPGGTTITVDLSTSHALMAVYLACTQSVSKPVITPEGPVCMLPYAVAWLPLAGASGYEIQENGGAWVSTGTDTSKIFTPSVAGDYVYSVRPVSSCGAGAASATATISVDGAIPPVVPQPWIDGPSPVCINSQFAVSWDAVTGARSYEIRENGGSWSSVGAVPVQFYFKLVPGLYTYEVRSVNSCGASAPSLPVSITVTADGSAAPAAPTQPVVQPANPVCTGTPLTIRWNNVPAADYYQIRENGGIWQNCGSIPVWGMSPGGPGTFTYEIRAVNSCGASNASPAATVLIEPCYNIAVFSLHPDNGVAITLSPPDQNSKTGGTTPDAYLYANGQIVSIEVPAVVSGWNFLKWQRDGVDYSTNPAISLTVDGDRVMTAMYNVPILTIASTNPGSGVAIVVTPQDINGRADGTTPFTREYVQGTNVTLQAPAKFNGNPFEKWLRDGADYPGSQSIAFALDTNHTMTAMYHSVTGVEIETKSALSGSVPIHIKLSNEVSVRRVLLPLEIREVTPGTAITRIRVSYAERLTGYLTGISTALQFGTPDGNCKSGLSGGYKTATALMAPNVDVNVGALPVGISIVRGRLTDPALPAGADASGSIILTAFVSGSHGSFEIDTTCTNPANHLAFTQEDPPAYTSILPVFTKGTITITGDGCGCPSQGDLVLDGLIDVFDVITVIGVAFSGDPDPQDANCPKSRGDVNNDGVTDVFDVIYLIATAFSGGPNPLDPCNP